MTGRANDERDAPAVAPDELAAAATAIRDGDLVVYPTETVYGLGADALDAAAVETVFAAKQRPREKPVSMAVPDLDAATEYVRLTDRERAFADAFLPGPVTLLCEKRAVVPDVLTADRETVGVRIPDHDLVLALLERVAPITATSANVSGTGSVRRVAELSDAVLERADVVLAGGETPGGGSTVLDVEKGEIVRRGLVAEEVEAWLSGEDR